MNFTHYKQKPREKSGLNGRTNHLGLNLKVLQVGSKKQNTGARTELHGPFRVGRSLQGGNINALTYGGIDNDKGLSQSRE